VEVWRQAFITDPLPWLLERDTPAVRHLALRDLLDEPVDAPAVRRARAAAMRADPIASILANQHPDGWWVKPGAGYAPKYTGTVWSLMFLEQLGADPSNPSVRRACEYVLQNTQAATGAFICSGRIREGQPPPAEAIHCLHGNLLRSFIRFGWLDDERIRGAVEWQARSITGEGFDAFFRSGTSGPGFRCVANGHQPCAWGAIKALSALAAIPPRRRAGPVRRAIDRGVSFLLSRDPVVADYPTDSKVSTSWFRLGFPSGYVADVLQNLEVLAELGHARDARVAGAIDWLVRRQDPDGRYRNRYAYNGKLWADADRQGAQSKWVTLRAARVLRAALG
jgi:hypothetical protein